MKRNYRNLFMVGVCAFLGMFASCDEQPIDDSSNVEDKTIADNGKVALSLEQVSSTSATFSLKSSSIDAFAYYVHEGELAEGDLDPILLYAEAQEEGRVAEVKKGSSTFAIYGLEANVDYSVYLVYTDNDQFETLSAEFTTTAYERIITVIETNKDGFKFHIEVPDTMTYRWAILPLEQWNSYKDNWRHTDYGFLMDGRMAQGAQTIAIKDGDYWLYEDDPWSIYPGVPFIVLLAECDENGELDVTIEEEVWDDPWGDDDMGVWAPATRVGSSTPVNGIGEYSEALDPRDNAIINGLYARQIMYADVTMVESEIDINVVSKTQRRVTLSFSTDNVDLQYAVAPFSMEDYRLWVNTVSERAIPTTILTYYGADAYSGYTEIVTSPEYFPMMLDSTYIFGVVGIYEVDGSVLSYDTIHVTLTKSNMAPAEATIKGIEDPDGDANMVWFNVKSESQNVAGAKYLMNYTKEFVPMLNEYKSYGFTEEEAMGMLMDSYGNYLEEQDIAAINSAAGFDISFTSAEETESMLLLALYNAEEGVSYVSGTSTSGSIPALDRVNSTLFEELTGDWKAQLVTMVYDHYDYENYVSVYRKDTVSFIMTLATEPEAAPAKFDTTVEGYNDLYDWFYNNALGKGATDAEADAYAKELIEDQVAEYGEWQKHYAEKYYGQNYIVGRGYSVGYAPEYQSPWSLFIDLNYSAYAVQDLFYEYGPKLFFQVNADETITLLTDATGMTVAPLYTSGSDYVILGYNPENPGGSYSGNYPVEVSDDKNTITIKGAEQEDGVYYPAVGYATAYYSMVSYKVVDEVVLTRTTDEEAAMSTRRRTSKTEPVTETVNEQKAASHRRMRTKMLKPFMVERAEMKVVNLVDRLQEKYNEGLSK